MASALDRTDIDFLVLTNTESQFSIWPSICDIPAGWIVRYGPGSRSDCTAYVELTWIDMKPHP